jgi:hypothetical protein
MAEIQIHAWPGRTIYAWPGRTISPQTSQRSGRAPLSKS